MPSVSVKAPITFEQFLKNPTMAVFFLVTLAVGYLYIDNRINYTNQIDQCSERVIKLENKIDDLSFRLHRSDSILARTAARLEIMTELNNEN
tara:strand:- start:324 stop:599 length:276 start_codon:yes stop_codon:yes gene_type:complete